MLDQENGNDKEKDQAGAIIFCKMIKAKPEDFIV